MVITARVLIFEMVAMYSVKCQVMNAIEEN